MSKGLSDVQRMLVLFEGNYDFDQRAQADIEEILDIVNKMVHTSNDVCQSCLRIVGPELAKRCASVTRKERVNNG